MRYHHYLPVLFTCFTFLLFSCQVNEKTTIKEDFETYAPGQAPPSPWITSGNGSVSIDTSKAFSGRQSVHFISGEGYANRAFLETAYHFPTPQNTYTGQLKMFVQTAPPDGIHWTMIQSSGKVAGETYTSEIRYGGQHNKKLMANYDTQGVQSDCWQHSQTVIPEGKWFDVKWQFDGTKEAMQFWLDGKLIEDLTVKGKGEGCIGNGTNGLWRFPIMEKLTIGWVDYQQGGGERHVWIDDVEIFIPKD